MRYTSDSLIRLIRVRAQIPTNQVTFTDADLLQLADEELLIGIIPSMLVLHEDYYLVQEDTALVAETSSYKIPTRSIGNKLRDVSYVDNANNIFKMVRLQVEDQPGFNTFSNSTANLRYYFIRNNELQIMPGITGQVTGSLRFSYYMRPNNLVVNNQASLVEAINLNTGVITVDQVPDDFSTDNKYDFVMGKSSFKVLDYDISATDVNALSNTITFTEDTTFTGDITSSSAVVLNVSSTDDLFVGQSVTGTGIAANTTISSIDSTTQITLSIAATATTVGVELTIPISILPAKLQVGDYINIAGQTIIPNIPTELHSMLAQQVACRCLEALGDTQGLTNANLKLAEMKQNLGILIDNRVEGSPQKVVNKNSLIRRPFWWGRG